MTGDFSKAWQLVESGNQLAIAVGGAALHALYYNPCGWPNPRGIPAGHTPFEVFSSGCGIDAPRAGYFVNAAGCTAIDSLKLAVMLAYYAVHGSFPALWQGLPPQEISKQLCVPDASPSTSWPGTSTPAWRPAPSHAVGLYADFRSTDLVRRALQLGWRGLAATGGLGTRSRPYTAVLETHPDQNISRVLSQMDGRFWWLSFWTVSWPAGGDSFYEGGRQAGQYAGRTLMNYCDKCLPNFVILDPEGCNTPASSATEWSDWIHGWADGLKSVNLGLKPAFYCNQWQYQTYRLSSIELPAFIAVSPIQVGRPQARGGNVAGYIAYYATCPAAGDVARVQSWGAQWNTVQFRDSGVDCGP